MTLRSPQPMDSNYSAASIQILEGLQAVRKRPSMYIGDINTRGLHHLIWEVVDNAVDEALGGYCTEIHVTIHKDNAITVRDNGRGIPVDLHPKENKSALEIVMTRLHAGGKFDKDTYKVSGGLHGVGVSCVNALSAHLIAKVYRDGRIYIQEYHQGIPTQDVKDIGETTLQGTEIYFKPDATIFLVTSYDYHMIARRLRELAYLNAGLSIHLQDLRTVEGAAHPTNEIFHYSGGLGAFVEYLDAGKASLLPKPIVVQGEKNGVIVQAALSYNVLFNETIHSYVNNIPTLEGGTHVAGFRRGISRTIKAYGEAYGLFKSDLEVVGDDFRDGLTAVIAIKIADPQFEGQTKTKLGNTEASGAVEVCINEIVKAYLEENPKEARAIVNKIIVSAQARQAARKARELVLQRKNVLSGLPGKLTDCLEKDPEKNEIILVEGEGAAGTVKQTRNRWTQAVLVLKGKGLNVERAALHKIYANEQIKNIALALGISLDVSANSPSAIEKNTKLGKKPMALQNTGTSNIERLRYYKIIIMADADVDGSHIRSLILTLFFRYMSELIHKGYVYIALPPLYLVKRGEQERYCWTKPERDAAIAELTPDGKLDAVVIQRYKGLGEMNASQIFSTIDPAIRRLKKVFIHSADGAEHLFSLLMGDDIPSRKAYIEQHAQQANLDV